MKADGEEQMARLAAAEGMARLAATQDSRSASRVDALRRPYQAVARDFATDTPEYASALSGARAACLKV